MINQHARLAIDTARFVNMNCFLPLSWGPSDYRPQSANGTAISRVTPTVDSLFKAGNCPNCHYISLMVPPAKYWERLAGEGIGYMHSLVIGAGAIGGHHSGRRTLILARHVVQ
jgi:hypothetical protein